MYLYIYIHMVYVHVYICVSTHIYIYVFPHVYVYIYIYCKFINTFLYGSSLVRTSIQSASEFQSIPLIHTRFMPVASFHKHNVGVSITSKSMVPYSEYLPVSCTSKKPQDVIGNRCKLSTRCTLPRIMVQPQLRGHIP